MQIKKIKFLRVPYFTYSQNKNQRLKCEHFPPLALGVIASYLENKGIKLELDDLHIKVHYDNLYSNNGSENIDDEPFFDKERTISFIKGEKDKCLENIIERIIKKTNLDGYDLVLLSSPSPIDISPLSSTLLISKYIKEKTQAKVIVGGDGCSELWRLGLEKGLIDFVIQGPGEIPLLKLIMDLTNDLSFQNIPGLCYVNNSNVIIDTCSQYVLPVLPDFDGLPIEKYHWFPDDFLCQINPKNDSKEGILILPFRFVIGCPFHCTFCCESGKAKQILFITPNEAVDYIEVLSKKYKTKYFFFLHSTLNFTRDYINNFCDEVIRRELEIYWTDCANFKYLDRNILFKMKQAGAIRLIWGLETGSPRLLQYINKGMAAEWAAEMLQISHEVGIWNGLEIICGLPHEKEEDIRYTIDFLNRNNPYLDTVYFNPFYLDGSSLLFKHTERYGVENVRRVQRYATHRTDDPLDNYVFEFAFDEINGLKWEDKIKQVAYSCDKVIHSTKGGFWTNEMEAILFYLYSNLKDKSQIKEIYNKWTDFKKQKVI